MSHFVVLDLTQPLIRENREIVSSTLFDDVYSSEMGSCKIVYENMTWMSITRHEPLFLDDAVKPFT